MKIGKTLYVKTREAWRAWLARHHESASEIWLVYSKKHSGTPRIPSTDAVEEAFCVGWIDGIAKPVDDVCWVQRFSPRRSTSRLSDMNRERVRRLVAARRMTQAGLERIKHVFDPRTDKTERGRWTVPADILRRLKRDPTIWKNFPRFPPSYRRIRIGSIVAPRKRADGFAHRLR